MVAMPHEDHFAGCGCEEMGNENMTNSGKSLPPGIADTDNLFDFFEMYALRGAPTDMAVFVNDGTKVNDALDRAVVRLQELSLSRDTDLAEFSKIEPLMEFLFVISWGDGESYHIRFSEVVAVMLLQGLLEHFERGPMPFLAMYSKALLSILYGEQNGLVRVEADSN